LDQVIKRHCAARGFMDSPSSLILELIFSSIGLGYFIYGKKQKTIVPLLSGIGLMVFPYLVSNAVFIFILGILLSAIPYFLRF
jgi:hypothetical protein